MSSLTPNYGLVKPDPSDTVSLSTWNNNWDTIDTQIKTVSDIPRGQAWGYTLWSRTVDTPYFEAFGEYEIDSSWSETETHWNGVTAPVNFSTAGKLFFDVQGYYNIYLTLTLDHTTVGTTDFVTIDLDTWPDLDTILGQTFPLETYWGQTKIQIKEQVLVTDIDFMNTLEGYVWSIQTTRDLTLSSASFMVEFLRSRT